MSIPRLTPRGPSQYTDIVLPVEGLQLYLIFILEIPIHGKIVFILGHRRQVMASHDINYAGYMGAWLPEGWIPPPCAISVLRNDRNCKNNFMFPCIKSAGQGLMRKMNGCWFDIHTPSRNVYLYIYVYIFVYIYFRILIKPYLMLELEYSRSMVYQNWWRPVVRPNMTMSYYQTPIIFYFYDKNPHPHTCENGLCIETGS